MRKVISHETDICDIDWHYNNRTIVLATHIGVVVKMGGHELPPFDACDECAEHIGKSIAGLLPPLGNPAATGMDTTGHVMVPTEIEGAAVGRARGLAPRGVTPWMLDTPVGTINLLTVEDDSPQWWDAYKAWMDRNGIKYKYPSGVSYTPKSKKEFRAHIAQMHDRARGESKPEGGDL
jgi:hypothetical protein